MINFTERQIQQYIWNNKDHWSEMVIDIEYPALHRFDGDNGLVELNAEKLLHNMVIERTKDLHDRVKHLNFYGMEVPLGNKGEAKIRADFLAAHEGAPGIYIIELKKSKQTEREAFTELLAYANFLNGVFPSHCIDDTILVLITPLESNTVKGAFLQSFLFDRKAVCLLTPSFSDPTDISTLKLTPYVPSLSDLIKFSNVAFSKRNFDVEVAVWDDVPDFWNTPNQDPDDEQEQNMNKVAILAAQMMEAKHIHGFVYTQQLWPELKKAVGVPNKLVMVALNPYKVANDQYYLDNHPDIPIKDIPDVYSFFDEHGLNMTHLIPGLKKHLGIHEDWNYFSNYAGLWGSHLMRIGREAVKNANINRVNKSVHVDLASGGSWDVFECEFVENIATFNFDIYPTGILRELYWQTTKWDYKYWTEHDNHPIQGDAFGWAIENSSSHILFSIFLDRMFFNEDYEMDDDDDEEKEDMGGNSDASFFDE